MERLTAVGPNTDWNQVAFGYWLESQMSSKEARKLRPKLEALMAEMEADPQLAFNLRPRADITAADVKQFEPYIKKMIRTRVHHYESSDVCMDQDDLMQLGRIMIWEAYQQFDPSRGAKLSTFVILKLLTKFMNLGDKFRTANRKGTLNFTAMTPTHFASGDAQQDIQASTDILGSTESPEDALADAIDTRATLAKLAPRARGVYIDRYLNGLSVKEMQLKRRTDQTMKQFQDILGLVNRAHEENIQAE